VSDCTSSTVHVGIFCFCCNIKKSKTSAKFYSVEIGELAESGGKYQEAPHVIEVILPMLCSYLPYWLAQGTIMADG
jgi:hypothetical protein